MEGNTGADHSLSTVDGLGGPSTPSGGKDTAPTPDGEPDGEDKPSSAYVWIGSSTNAGPSRMDHLDEEDLALRDGIGIVYVSVVVPLHLICDLRLNPAYARITLDAANPQR